MRESVERQAGDELQSYRTRGVYVPHGVTAHEIIEGARVLEEDFGVIPYTSRAMVRAVLLAIRSGTNHAETYDTPSGGSLRLETVRSTQQS